jgi:hypothetical protein
MTNTSMTITTIYPQALDGITRRRVISPRCPADRHWSYTTCFSSVATPRRYR